MIEMAKKLNYDVSLASINLMMKHQPLSVKKKM